MANPINTNSSKIAIEINLGSPNGIPTKPVNSMEIMTPNTKGSDLLRAIDNNDRLRSTIYVF